MIDVRRPIGRSVRPPSSHPPSLIHFLLPSLPHSHPPSFPPLIPPLEPLLPITPSLPAPLTPLLSSLPVPSLPLPPLTLTPSLAPLFSLTPSLSPSLSCSHLSSPPSFSPPQYLLPSRPLSKALVRQVKQVTLHILTHIPSLTGSCSQQRTVIYYGNHCNGLNSFHILELLTPWNPQNAPNGSRGLNLFS